eukprot:1380314-Amphidinium_carterae.1
MANLQPIQQSANITAPTALQGGSGEPDAVNAGCFSTMEKTRNPNTLCEVLITLARCRHFVRSNKALKRTSEMANMMRSK